MVLTVVLPTFLSSIYFGAIASDIYTSESRFVVRSADKAQPSGLGVLLTGVGFSKSNDATSTVEEYLTSRDALKELDRAGALREAFSSSKASPLDRFGGPVWGSSREHLYKFYLGKVAVSRDETTGVTTLTVNAFSPEHARMINRQLLEISEDLVNRVSARGRNDLIAFAEAEVGDAKRKVQASSNALSAYRNRVRVVDPERQAAVQMQMISKLQDQLISTRAQLNQLQIYTPQSPQLSPTRDRVNWLSREINAELSKVAGDKQSLAGATAKYQQLVLESKVAEQQLAGALASLQDARNEARRKQAYIERISEPSLSDYPAAPRRLRGVLATFVLGLIAWGIARMLMAGIKEHEL